MKKFINDYPGKFMDLINTIRVTDNHGKEVVFSSAIESVCRMIIKRSRSQGKVFLIGNGGSAAIASHMAIDFWKNAGIQSMAFNDGSLLTCISNDFGYEHVFAKPIEFFAHRNDILFAISSSGKSKNILKGARAALSKGCYVITLSGFDKDTPLRTMGFLNFYVPSSKYGFVEVIHQYICHYVLDAIILYRKNG